MVRPSWALLDWNLTEYMSQRTWRSPRSSRVDNSIAYPTLDFDGFTLITKVQRSTVRARSFASSYSWRERSRWAAHRYGPAR
jgi:hypothetical protein